MSERLVVAIDGPSGTGKSTVSRRLAAALGARYLDTGAMYRAVTWAVLEAGVDPADAAGVEAVAAKATLASGTDPAAPHISVDGRPVDVEIRGPEVTGAVSAVAAVAAVRTRLVAQQRDIIHASARIVVEGRDITTVVAPDAEVKIFLTASEEVRAARRNAETAGSGFAPTLAATLADIARRDKFDSTRATDPLRRADDAVELDTTGLTIDQVVDAMLALAREGDPMTDADYTDFEDFEDFDPADFNADDFEDEEPGEAGPGEIHGPALKLPVVAVVGRPNVGKSTLVNRMIGRRQAVVQDTPGVTRDRVAYDADWSGRRFTVVDTGGWEPDARDRAKAIAAQAEMAVATADVVLFVVDTMVGSTDVDEAAVKMLRRSKKPVILVANKVDNANIEMEAVSLWGLGLGEPFPVSALHGRGAGDLLDKVLAAFPEPAPRDAPRGAGPRRVALVGRPNVGKSSLLNRLAKEERAVVDSVAGTTVDPVDSLITLGGETWLFVDTAGLRRRVSHASGTEYYASLRTQAALDAAEVVVVLLDAGEPISEQDQRVLSMVAESGRALVLAFNKWDLVDEDRRYYLDKEIDRELRRIPWALRVNISAMTGRAVEKIAPALRTALANWGRRIPTGQLNAWMTALVQGTPHPIRGGRAIRVMFATQAGANPPKFVLFTNGLLDTAYIRFIERKLREEWDFTGTPIQISVRPRKKAGSRQ